MNKTMSELKENKVETALEKLKSEPTSKVKIGERIKSYRKKKKITQKELGKLIGCDKQTISLYERGKFNPAAHIIVALADVLEITTDEILREDPYSYPKAFLRDDELLSLLIKLNELPSEDKKAVKNLLEVLVKNNTHPSHK